MNSTSDVKYSDAIRKLYSEKLLPLASEIEVAGIHRMTRGCDQSVDSYYSRRPVGRMKREDFLLLPCSSLKEFEEYMNRIYNPNYNSEVSSVIAELCRITQSVFDFERQDDEVSPFIYVMF